MTPTITRTSTAEVYDAYVVKNYARPALTLVRGRGCTVWDDQGRAYLDFTSGIAVSALGHCHPVWVEAVQRQAGELIHVSNLFRNPQQGELARQLVQRAGPGRVFFCNSGAEANEALIKLARLPARRKEGRWCRGPVLQDHLRPKGVSRPHLRRHERDAPGEDPEGLCAPRARLRLR